jgi:hypothetical protein
VVWWGLVVRGDEREVREVREVGPVQEEQTCVEALLAHLEQLGYRGRVVAQHDKGFGCLIEGTRAWDGASINAICWPTEHMTQGCLEIHFQRQGNLAPVRRSAPPRRLVVSLS